MPEFISNNSEFEKLDVSKVVNMNKALIYAIAHSFFIILFFAVQLFICSDL